MTNDGNSENFPTSPAHGGSTVCKVFEGVEIGYLSSGELRKCLLQVLLTMIDPTTGPLITHHKAVLSFMSQQLQPLRKEWDGEKEGKKTKNSSEINELTTVFKGAECGRLVSQLK